MSDNTTDSDASLKEQIERMKEKISYKAVNYEDGLEYYRLQYEAEDDLDKLEELIRSDSRKAKASGVRVNARVSDNRRGGSISINWGEYGGFYWLNKSFTKRLCIGWLAITYWPIDLDEMIERLLH